MDMMTTNPQRSNAPAVFDIAELVALVDRVRAEMVPALEELIAKLEAAAASEAELEFGGLVKAAQQLLELDDTDMARTLNVSRPTIGRWIRGVSAPHPLTRSAICGALVKKARSKIKLFQN
jgi:DNA-binding XRE family transcriptional regulator